jgi:hypothetical protein
MYMVILVLHNPTQFDAILNSWEKVGIRGATIFESSGVYHHLRRLIPMRYYFQAQTAKEEGNLTIMAIVDSIKAVKKCLAATESVTGSLDNPNTGIFAAWPLTIVKGLPTTSG